MYAAASTAGTYVAAGITRGLPRNLFCDPWVDEAPLLYIVVLRERTPAGRMPAGGQVKQS